MTKRNRMKNVYVVKSDTTDIEEQHQELETKSVYLLKADDHVINKYSDIVYRFVDGDDGLFLIISQDRTFYNNFRKSFYKELRIDQERIRLSPNKEKAFKEIRIYREHDKHPLLFLEANLDGRSTLPFLEELKAAYKDMLVIVLTNDGDKDQVAQFVEAGADNFITKPISLNVLIEKIANTLVPQDEIGKLVREGKRKLGNVEFALAYGVARDILQRKPGSPAGLLIMGDALKGLTKRDDALKLYLQAAQNAPMYLEPLKKIVEYYREDDDEDGVLRYLERIDDLSPLHPGRKREIGEIYLGRGDIQKAATYLEESIRLTHAQRLPECVTMAVKYADEIFGRKEEAAEGLLTLCTRLARAYRVEAHWSWYNRLGMLLRRRKCWQEAVKAYGEAAIRAPEDATIPFNRGMAYVEGKDLRRAAEQFQQAIRLDSSLYEKNIEAAYIMGQVFARAHYDRDAAKVLGHIQNVRPGYKKVESILQSLKR
ncbi:response regulator [Pseudodesulfovibrio cashew]|uniref:Response regulator n=1 Tax=Pseudodesulfovibrio cashew TaxID=2678688 RepID=A0A6I6JHH7_9BACT|nr:response regulator [Pseudodesulfovibrio cashew]QGY40480.1 response regulator [Pseudodesulfovibrio cashew]